MEKQSEQAAVTEDVYISFYLKRNRLHLFTSTLRRIGSPSFICFMMDTEGHFLILSPYHRKDYHSHRVPAEVYQGKKSLELSSYGLCKVLAKRKGWEPNKSYRIPGRIIKSQNIAVFEYEQAKMISEDCE